MTEPADLPPAQGTRHTRHYTLDQAMAVRGWVAERVRRVRAAQTQLELIGPGLTQAIATLEADSGGAYPGREVAGPLVQISHALRELDAEEIVLRGRVRGLLDLR